MGESFGSHSAVCHEFANLGSEQFTREGYAGGVFFENGTLYSYGRHFALAKYFESVDHELFVLLTTDTYSNSTSKHQSITRSALSHHRLLFVPRADNSPSENFNSWESTARQIADKLARARKPEIYISELGSLQSRVKAYCDALDVQCPDSLSVYFADDQTRAELLDKIKARQIAERKAAIEKEKADVSKWKSLETDYLHAQSGLSYLRFNPSRGRIETSQHIALGLMYARQFWQMIRYSRENQDFKTLLGFRVLDRFQVRTFNARQIKIGCHTILHSEIDAIANQMKWKMPELQAA